MKKSTFTEEQSADDLCQVESGSPPANLLTIERRFVS